MKRTNVFLTAFLAAATVCFVSCSDPPLGFTGVRGKKSIPDSAYSEPTQTVDVTSTGQAEIASHNQDGDMSPNAISGVMDKRAPSGFLGMRGKKPMDEWGAAPQPEFSMGYFKRAPSGFLGMRGKKENFYYDYDKRAPSGFLGMRGKKDYDLMSDNYDFYEDKRAPSGFFGMRGKKEFDPFYEEIKRAPNSGFFGMRGKKQPGRSGFFGMRGKKYPYEFRGKFVGVRGKKMANSVYGPDLSTLDEQLESLGQNLDFNQLMLLLTENGEGWPAAARFASDEYNGQDKDNTQI